MLARLDSMRRLGMGLSALGRYWSKGVGPALNDQQLYRLALSRGFLRLCYHCVPLVDVTPTTSNVPDILGSLLERCLSCFGAAASVIYPHLTQALFAFDSMNHGVVGSHQVPSAIPWSEICQPRSPPLVTSNHVIISSRIPHRTSRGANAPNWPGPQHRRAATYA